MIDRHYRWLVLSVLISISGFGSRSSAQADDCEWNLAHGGNSFRTGSSECIGPHSPNVIWEGSRTAFTADAPLIGDGKVFLSRIDAPDPLDEGGLIVAHDLDTGAELWAIMLPMDQDDIPPGPNISFSNLALAYHDGHVYAVRSGAGSGNPLYALDPANGSIVWASEEDVEMGGTTSPAFVSNGDLLVKVRCCFEAAPTIETTGAVHDFDVLLSGPGGTLGGDTVSFDAILTIDFQGTGNLATVSGSVDVPVQITIDLTARTPGDAVQAMNATIGFIGGAVGDDQLDFVNVVGGEPLDPNVFGTVTLTRQGDPGAPFLVESNFIFVIQLNYQGAAGSPLDGIQGELITSTRWTQSCIAPDNGMGTVDYPADCDFIQDPLVLRDGLEAGTTCLATAPSGPVGAAICGSLPTDSNGSTVFMRRIDKDTGATVWTSQTWHSPGSGASNMAVFGERIYAWSQIADPIIGGISPGVAAFDAATGDELFDFAIPLIDFDCIPPEQLDVGIPAQQTGVFVGPDGTVYAPRQSQCLVALEDAGDAFVEKWRTPMGGAAFSTYAIGPDGTIYVTAPFNPGDPVQHLQRLDPATGAVLDTTTVGLEFYASINMAIDSTGKLYVSNGWPSLTTGTGMIYCYTPDLEFLWADDVPGIGFFGGPALGQDGTLVVAGKNNLVRAYRNLQGDLNCDGVVDLLDAMPLALALVDVAAYENAHPGCSAKLADVDGNGSADGNDVRAFVDELLATPPLIDLLSQDRSLFVSAEAPGAFDEPPIVEAPDFGPFNETTTALADNGTTTVTSTATQNSSFDDDRILATGSVSGGITVASSTTAFSDNLFEATFELHEPVAAMLMGSLTAAGDETTANFQLTGPSGTVYSVGPVLDDTQLLLFNGLLPPGVYTIRASTAFEFATAGNSNAGYDVDFNVFN